MKKCKQPVGACAILLVLFCWSCVTPNNPPPMSFAKFVRDPVSVEGELTKRTGGKIGLGTGMVIYGTKSRTVEDDDFSSAFYFFPVEGALSLWLADMYDLALSLHNGALFGLEGNLMVVKSGGFRLGIVHGLGLGFGGEFTDIGDDWEGGLWADFSGGLMFQFGTGPAGAGFLGFKYTFATSEELGGSGDEEETDTYTHFLTGSLGYMFIAGGLRITPEIIVSYGDWRYDEPYNGPEVKTDVWIILPTISVAAIY